MKIAFYAPMKSPKHPTPSGDRRMARLFIAALEGAGHDVSLASEFRSFCRDGTERAQVDIRRAAQVEAEGLIEKYRTLPADERPALWFSYHLYHKAPDWIGPYVCAALDIPYMVAEASHAPKQKSGPWAIGYEAAEKAITKASRVFHMTRLDGECLAQIIHDPAALVPLPPFIERLPQPASAARGLQILTANGGLTTRKSLLCVAMMRDGDKFRSYQQLSDVLGYLRDQNWQLLIAGDGQMRPRIEKLMARFGDRIIYLGRRDDSDLADIFAAADIYVWPACGEAFGMAFLEAQRAGTPVVAGRVRGVPDVVEEGRTGLLAPADNPEELAALADKLLKNDVLRAQMGKAAKQFVEDARSLEAAAAILKKHIEQVVA